MSSLTNRKLKVWSASPRQTVMVFQDGTATDPDVTFGFRFDDAFRSGAGTSPPTGRSWIWVSKITNDYDTGPTLVLKYVSTGAWFYNQYPGIAFQPNDRVEFYCDAPSNNAAVLTPAWHLNGQAGQVMVFRGWVETFESQGGVISVTCRSALWRANDVTLMRDAANGIQIPKIAFNVEPDSPEFLFSVKKTATTPQVTYGTGSPQSMTDNRMTLAEILNYLQASYGAELQAAGVIPGTTIWSSSEVASLTIKPGPVVLEDVGWTEGIRQLLSAWAPDLRIVVDPRTQIWHLVRAMASMKTTSTTLVAPSERVFWSGAWRTRVTVAAGGGALFSNVFGQDGFFARLIDAADPSRTDLGTVFGVAGDTILFHEDLVPAGTYELPDKLLPMQAEILPTLPVNFDTEIDPQSLSLACDLHDVYSAVNIASINLKTDVQRGQWNPGIAAAQGQLGVKKGWDAAYEALWKPQDADRERDQGPDGQGIPVYKYDTGGTGGNYRLFVAYEDTQYKDDHLDDEWLGCSLWVLTANNFNARPFNFSFRIARQTGTSDIGNGKPGLVLEIATTTFPTAVGGVFVTALNAVGSQVPDKVAITQSFMFSTTTDTNRRWEVGRKWVFTSTTLHASDTSPHQFGCKLPQFSIHDGSGLARQEIGLNPNLTHPPLNVQPGQNWIRADGGQGPLYGQFGVFRRAFYTQRPATGLTGTPGCDRQGWNPPRAIEVEWETTTTTIRNARYPASVYDGLAYRYFGIQRVRNYTAQHWFNDSQNATYEDLAYRLWNAQNHINYRGAVTCLGAKEFLAWIDMGIRVGFRTQMFPAGGGGILTQFWGILNSIEVDLESLDGKVNMSFDADSTLKNLALTVFEDLSVTQASKVMDIAAIIRKQSELPECLAGARPTATSPMQCDSLLSSGGRNVGVRVRVPTKDNLGVGLGIAAMGVASGGAGGTTTHGPNATETVFQDLQGNPFLITSGEAILPGTQSGAYVSPNAGSAATPSTLVSQAQSAASAAATMWGLTPQVTPGPIMSSIVTTAVNAEGNTVFTIRHSGTPQDALASGKIHVLDLDGTVVRGAYPILGNQGSSIVVAPTGHPSPGIDTPCVLFFPPAPRPAASSFPNGGLVVRDPNGLYGVIDYASGVLYPGKSSATEVNAIEKDPTATMLLRLGPRTLDGGAVQYDLAGGFPAALAGAHGADSVGYNPPDKLVTASTVKTALDYIFKTLIAQGVYEEGAFVRGQFDFSDASRSGLVALT